MWWAVRDAILPVMPPQERYPHTHMPTTPFRSPIKEAPTTAHLWGKSKGMLCGVPFFNAVFAALECTVEWQVEEGHSIDPSTTPGGKVLVATVKGKARHVLLGERTALNILTRASGIATLTHQSAQIGASAGWHGAVAGTRKTTPGFRLVEKYALLVGGAATHRHDLSQMVMLKDNHVWSTGSITRAVAKARGAGGFSTKIEVEARSFEEATEAAQAGADIVMLDNFSPEALKATAAKLKEAFPHVTIEASGGITNETMAQYFSPHVDVISQGSLTQGYPALDFSLKVER